MITQHYTSNQRSTIHDHVNITPLIIKLDSSDYFIFSRNPFPQEESISAISVFFFRQTSLASRWSWMSWIHRRRFVMHPYRTFLVFSHSCSDTMISC